MKTGRVEKPVATPVKKPMTTATVVKQEEMPTPPAEVSFSPMMSFESAYGGTRSDRSMNAFAHYDDEY